MGHAPRIISTALCLGLAGGLTAVTHGTLAAQAPTGTALEGKVDAYMRAAMQHDQFSGTIMLARAGVPLVSRGYGMANYELAVPNTAESVFIVGSLTKQFTAVAILQLRDRGRLSVSDPICQYLDRCPAAWQPITIRHLLTHTSGIPNFSSLPEWDDSLSMLRIDRFMFVNTFRDLPLLFTPGERFRYSNSGYYLLGLIIERASGLRFGEFLHRNIFVPLGMASTRVDDTRSLVPNRATGYYWGGNGFINALQQNVLLSQGSAGIISTTGDLLRWDAALYTDTLLSRSSRDELFTPVLNGYAYGVEIRQTLGRPTTTHSGSQYGFSSYLMRFPTEHVTIIVLANSDRTSATKVANDLAAIYYDAPYTLPEPQPFDIISAMIAEQGVEAGMRHFRELRRTSPAKEAYNEDLLNELGYDLLGLGKVNDAIAVFTLAVELYPASGNAHDSLAEGYMMRGDKALAVKFYEQSLQLDPENSNAVMQLRKLREGG